MNKRLGAAPADQVPTLGCCDCCMATALAELLGWHQSTGTTTGAWDWLWGQGCRGCCFGSDPTRAHGVWQCLHLPVYIWVRMFRLHSLEGSRLSPQDFLLQSEHWAGVLRWEGYDPNSTPQSDASSVPNTLGAQHSPR